MGCLLKYYWEGENIWTYFSRLLTFFLSFKINASIYFNVLASSSSLVNCNRSHHNRKKVLYNHDIFLLTLSMGNCPSSGYSIKKLIRVSVELSVCYNGMMMILVAYGLLLVCSCTRAIQNDKKKKSL